MENHSNKEEEKEISHLKEELKDEINELHNVEKKMENTLHEIESMEKKEGEDHERIIYVNTREIKYNGKEISFRQVVLLDNENNVFNDQIIYTVSYSKGVEEKPKGFLTDNESIRVKNKMIFDVERADRS